MNKKKKKKTSHFIFSRYVDDGEKILQVAHRHVLVFKVAAIKASGFGVILPLFLYYLFPSLFFVWLLWLFVGFLVLAYHFIDWYFDVWLLTNFGVVDIERNGLFDFTATRVDYHMMEGIAYTVKGFWRTVFNFGDITIDKLGTKTSVSLKDAASPKKLESSVMHFQEKFVTSKSLKDHQALKSMLSEMIAYHVQSKKIDPDK